MCLKVWYRQHTHRLKSSFYSSKDTAVLLLRILRNPDSFKMSWALFYNTQIIIKQPSEELVSLHLVDNQCSLTYHGLSTISGDSPRVIQISQKICQMTFLFKDISRIPFGRVCQVVIIMTTCSQIAIKIKTNYRDQRNELTF